MATKKILSLVFFLGIYLLSSGVSFAAFNYFVPVIKMIQPIQEGTPGEEKEFLIDVSGPKTETCPINGQKYTKAEKEAWSQRRPLFVMIENHEESRPQSGLSSADIVYETVAEGGITRFGAVFYCGAQAKETIIGPVRSARTYFLDWASEYGETPIYVHVGGAHCDPQTGEGCLNGAKADALGQIGKYGWEGENDLNQFSIGYPTFWRDYERLGRTVATEHTMYSTTERLWAVAKERGWTNKDPEGTDWKENFTSWKFREKEGPQGEDSFGIEFGFWAGYDDYKVKWDYNSESKEYVRSNGGKPHSDLNNNEQLRIKNLIVMSTKESSANDGYPGNLHLLYKTIGEGKALIFQEGKAYQGTWETDSRTGRTKFFLANGKELEFLPGKIWIEILPLEAEVSY